MDVAAANRDIRPMADLRLEDVKVVLYDHQHNIRAIVRSVLDGLGFRQIQQCRSLRELGDAIDAEPADLLILDLDEDIRASCELINDIRYERRGLNPFVVTIGLTWRGEAPVIESALRAGTDDLVKKPISVHLLAQRITNLIHNRKSFVAAPEYVGPLRAGGGEVPAHAQFVEVPNSLREKSTGERKAGPSEESLRRAAETVSLRRLHGLASEIGTLAADLESRLGNGAGDLDDGVRRIAALSEHFGELSAASRSPSVQRLSESMIGLVRMVTDSGRPNRKHVEILRLHAQAIAAVSRGDVGAFDDVAFALDRATSLIGEDGARAPSGLD